MYFRGSFNRDFRILTVEASTVKLLIIYSGRDNYMCLLHRLWNIGKSSSSDEDYSGNSLV